MFFAGASISRSTFEKGSTDDSDTDWGLTAGVTPIAGLLVTTEYFNNAGYDFNLHAKYVKALKGETAFNLEAIIADAEDKILGISADYYFNKNFSLGANIMSADKNSYGFQGKLFMSHRFSVGAKYSREGSANQMLLEAGFRF
jgi:predicted porin